MPIYAITIFTGAFLLFQVQPLIGKFILPWFGGGPGVWSTCLLFFQAMLLAGYAYAHGASRWLRPRPQAWVHLALLAAALALLPIVPGNSWQPEDADRPVGRILLLLTATVGLPYFVLSTTGPLLQSWFSQTHPGRSPYRLYALSNAGSLLALLTYPVFFEARFTRETQAFLWGVGLGFYCLVCALCAWRFAQSPKLTTPTDLAAPAELASTPRRLDLWLWFLLPACASILLLAITNKLCLDVAAVPFLWVAPLSLYLLSFIVSFDSPRWYRRPVFTPLLFLALPGVVWAMHTGADWPVWRQAALYCGALFVGCMVCHGELYRLRPAPSQLTGFYLAIAAGGALGGLFVAVIAPGLFLDYYELPTGILLCAVLAVLTWARPPVPTPTAHLLREFVAASSERAPCLELSTDGGPGWRERIQRSARWRLLTLGLTGLLVVGLVVALWKGSRESAATVVYRSRNFYGVLSVHEYNTNDPLSHYALLQHGRITHGLQFREPAQAQWPASYYAENSGVGLALNALTGERKIGVVGLGTASLLSYARAGDVVRFYEIDPQVVQVASTHFTYLTNTPARVELVLGDARLSLDRESSQQFDLLALDAFSSDSIPVHLLTREAFAIYQRHLKSEGVLAVHISNQFLDLQPVVRALAEDFGYQAVTIDFEENEEEWWLYSSTWMLVSRPTGLLELSAIRDLVSLSATNQPTLLWTDDFSSVFRVLLK